MKKDNTIILNDGRQLGYAEYGAKDGIPIFGLHGTPGSRIWFAYDDIELHAFKIRFITIDRPGYGLSDLHPQRNILDFTEDLIQLADFLGLDKFAVMGVSGGGIFSAATAFAFPDRVTRAGLISTVSPFEKGRAPKAMNRANRWSFRLARQWPGLLRYMLRQQKKLIDKRPVIYKSSAQKQVRHLSKSDQRILQEVEAVEALYVHLKEAYRMGVEGLIQETVLVTKEWGFDPSQIEVPVELWHGTDDTMAPIDPIQGLESKLKYVNTHYLQGKGHFLTEEPAIWKAILESMTENQIG